MHGNRSRAHGFHPSRATGRTTSNGSSSVWTPIVRTVAPEHAELFVIPVMCSQSAQGLCGGCHRHREHVKQLQQYLNASKWYRKSGGTDHLIVCDKYSSVGEVRRALPRVIIGRYEHLGGFSKYSLARVRTRTISVGYATTSGTVCSASPQPITALASRRYDVLSQMGTKPRPYGQAGCLLYTSPSPRDS